MIHLRSVDLKESARLPDGYPFHLPLVRQFQKIVFEAPVTFLVGENGSGKSTLLEAIAAAARSVTAGQDDVERDETLAAARELGKRLRLAWNKRTHKGLFLRSEDFFGFSRRLNAMRRELDEQAQDADRRFTGYARLQARGAALGQKAAIEARYGGDLDARSHGESFLLMFQSRFVPGGLYLLDEPETPLSPQRQIAFLVMLREMADSKAAQFIIATHSPILMSFPGARILSFDEIPPRETPFEEVGHVSLTRAFLADPDRFIRKL